MSVQDIINGAVTVQKTISGIVTAFADSPPSLSQLPCFVTTPAHGTLKWPREMNIRTQTHDFDMYLYVQKGGDIQAADRILKPYIDLVTDTFDQNIQLNGSCLTSGVVSYKYGKLEYGGVEYLGIAFVLRAVEKKQVVYKA